MSKVAVCVETDEVVDRVARCLYRVTRGMAVVDKLAVGLVILERVKRPGWWGVGFDSVIREPNQFGRSRHSLKPLDLSEWSATVRVADFVVNDATDRDMAQVWGTSDPDGFPTHFYLREQTRPKSIRGGRVTPTFWDSTLIFIAGADNDPCRGGYGESPRDAP